VKSLPHREHFLLINAFELEAGAKACVELKFVDKLGDLA
jgi:hypothetical protein